MQQARALSGKPGTGLTARASAARLRLDPVFHLDSGEIAGAEARTDRRYEDRAVFGPAGLSAEAGGPAHSPAEDLAARLEQAANAALASPRPIHIAVPLAALSHADTATACAEAAARCAVLPQEIVLDIPDAALAASVTDRIARLRRLAACGFRLGLDARQGWSAPLCGALRLMLFSMRAPAGALDADEDLLAKTELAAASGVRVIAEAPRWRDAGWLVRLGVAYAVRPQADA